MELSQEGVLRTAVLESLVRFAAQGETYVTAKEVAEDARRSKVAVHRALNSLRARGLVDFLEHHQLSSDRSSLPGRRPGKWFLLPGFEDNATELNAALALSDEAMRLIGRGLRQLGTAGQHLQKAASLLSARDSRVVDSVTFPSRADAELIVATASKLTELVARFEIENTETEE